MIRVEHPSGDIITYAYNGDGLRVREDDGVEERRFFYDGNNLLRVGVPDDVVPTAIKSRTLQQLTTKLQQRGIELIIIPIK
ncbi:MAG: hypothetical protein JNL58_12210 [Planctomyces sp.]|nr:hypothetical protein [Planctomyces sp.]